MNAREFVNAVQTALEAHRNAERANGMAAYMKNHFAFLGVPAPTQQAALRPLWPARSRVTAAWLREVAHLLFHLPEREYHYAAVAALRRYVKVLEANDLEHLTTLVLEKPWWDTIDAFASHTVGGLVTRFPALLEAMDEMSVHPNLWRRRIAILHQLGFKERTDWDRLCRYALENASHESFWIRKALGWAFREYARTDPNAVLTFFEQHGESFSGLTRREALKHFKA